MKTIVRTLFGSNLYGTATPESDTDYKSVHLPSAEELLLVRVRDTVSKKTKADPAAKNTADDVDDESFSLHRFFKMLENGDSLALEVMFAPRDKIITSTMEWDDIQMHRDRLLARNCKGFVSYCQRQAAKYGIRGSRVATVRAALELVTGAIGHFGPQTKVGDFNVTIEEFARSNEWTSIVPIETPGGGTLKHWEVCDRKLPYTISLKEASSILQKLFDNYGHRALAAEKNEGIDWKAMSHAVRVGRQAIELLTTGHLIFPRPEAAELLRIKRGELPYQQVSETLEALLSEVERVSETSLLPEAVDRQLMDDMTKEFYRRQILQIT